MKWPPMQDFINTLYNYEFEYNEDIFMKHSLNVKLEWQMNILVYNRVNKIHAFKTKRWIRKYLNEKIDFRRSE